MATDRSVSGSILQRTFIPEELATVLTVTSIPLDEIIHKPDLKEADALLKRLTTDIAGVPENDVLTRTAYNQLLQLVTYDIIGRPSHLAYKLPPVPIEIPAGNRLVSDALQLQAISSLPFWFSGPSRPRGSAYGYKRMIEDSRDLIALRDDTSVEAVQNGLLCINAASLEDDRATRLLDEVRTYDIPIAHSPKSESESLEKLLQTTKSIALVGLTASGTAAAGALGRGDFVTALICAGTGSAVTLIFISTIAASAILSSRAANYIRSARRSQLPRRKADRDIDQPATPPREIEE